MTKAEEFKKWYYSEKGIAYRQRTLEKRREQAKKYREKNKDKVKEIQRKYREKNLEKNRVYQREWARKNRHKYPVDKEKNKIRQQRYRERNREKIRKRSLAYNKKKIETDIQARLKWLFRGRITSGIRLKLGTQAYRTMELLGCTTEIARKHLESQFKDDMNWKNHGKLWEIDHIIPISHFDLTDIEQAKKAFNYKNLQPLYWRENRVKGNRMVI